MEIFVRKEKWKLEDAESDLYFHLRFEFFHDVHSKISSVIKESVVLYIYNSVLMTKNNCLSFKPRPLNRMQKNVTRSWNNF